MVDVKESSQKTGQPAETTNADGGPEETVNSGETLLGAGQKQSKQPEQSTSAEPTGENRVDPPEFLGGIEDENIRSDPSLRNIKSIEDLAKGYVHAQKLVGKERLVVPSDENDTEAWNDVLSKLGRPESADGYELPKPAEDSPAQLPEGMDRKFAEKAHELGLTNKQARDLFGWYVTDVAESEVNAQGDRLEQERQQAETVLRKEFGNAFNDRITDAQRALREYGDENGELAKMFSQTGLGNDPNVIRFLASIGEGLREDTVGGTSKPVGRSPDQAKQEIGQLKGDSAFMKTYLDQKQPGHKEAVERMRVLYQDAYPDS